MIIMGSPANVIRDIIREAASEELCVLIRYRSKDNEVTERIVEPYEIKNEMLYAYCQGREGIRCFKLGGILDANLTDQYFEPRFPVLIVKPGANQ